MIERPLVSASLSLYFCILLLVSLFSGKFIFAALAAIFFVANLFICNKKYICLILLISIMGISSFLIYYNYSIGEEENIRIIYNSSKYTLGEIGKRKVYIKGNLEGIKTWDYLFAKGKFYKKINYFNGNFGYYYIDKFIKKEDIISNIGKYKENIWDKLKGEIGSEKASIAMGITFGDKERLDEYVKEEYKEYGISHMLCVSGFHMSLTYFLLKDFFGDSIAIIGGFIYLILVGIKPQATRALIMILVASLGKKVNKIYDSLSSLSLSLIIILILSPYLALDLGLIISFLAVLGILLFYKYFQKKLILLPKYLSKTLGLSLSSQVFTMPFIGYIFNQINISFLVGNIILVPILSIIIYISLPLLVAIKFKNLFYINVFLLKSVFYLLDGGKKLINILILNPINISRYFLISLLFMLIFIIISKKYLILRKLYIPIIITIFLGKYSLITNVKIYDNVFIIKKGFHVYLVSDYYLDNEKSIIELKNKYNPNKIYTSLEDYREFRLDKFKYIFIKRDDKLELKIYNSNEEIGVFNGDNQGNYLIFK